VTDGPGGSSDAESWAARIERGLVRIATVTLLEVGYSARAASELQAGLRKPPIGAMPVEYATPPGSPGSRSSGSPESRWLRRRAAVRLASVSAFEVPGGDVRSSGLGPGSAAD
jgi:hypothetical protein